MGACLSGGVSKRGHVSAVACLSGGLSKWGRV